MQIENKLFLFELICIQSQYFYFQITLKKNIKFLYLKQGEQKKWHCPWSKVMLTEMCVLFTCVYFTLFQLNDRFTHL